MLFTDDMIPAPAVLVFLNICLLSFFVAHSSNGKISFLWLNQWLGREQDC